MRKIFYIIIFIGAIITLQIGLGNDAVAGSGWDGICNGWKGAGGNGLNFNKCCLAGVWEGEDGTLATIVPLDCTGKRFSVIHDAPKPPRDVSTFLPAYMLGLAHGTFVKIGPNLYEFNMQRFGVNEDGSGENYIVVKVVITGLTKFTDCDTRVSTFNYTVYNAGGDELNCKVPEELGYVSRIVGEEPCGDLLELPE